MTALAALPMYVRPELKGAYDRFWQGIAAHLRAAGIDAPDHLSAPDDLMGFWQDPDLVLSQTCGMPYRRFLHGKVQIVATPDYGLPGCPPGHYRSVIVVRQDDARQTLEDFAGATFAYNEENSQSGYAAPLNHAAPLGVTFPNRVQSHSHHASGRMVADGAADIAALDAVSWGYMQAFDNFAGNLRVLTHTAPPTPVLPFITALGQDAAAVRAALQAALDALASEDRKTIGIKALIDIAPEDYLVVPNPRA